MSWKGVVHCLRPLRVCDADAPLRQHKGPRSCQSAAGCEHTFRGMPAAASPPAVAVLAALFHSINGRTIRRKISHRNTKVPRASNASGSVVDSESRLLVLAERYTSFYWWQHMLDFSRSRILERISSHLSFNTILAGVVWLVQRETNSFHALPVVPLTLCSAALGLLLVFRTTAAYERWHLGQCSVYELRHHLQMILRVARAWIPDANFVRLQEQVERLPRAVAWRLTAKAGAGFLYGVSPREVMQEISEDLTEHFSDPTLSWGALSAADRIQGHIESALLLMTQMERLAIEAVPRAYSRHTGRFLTIWMWTLPWVLLDCGDAMPFAVTFISWALLSIEEIGHCLEDPYNSPTEPIDIQAILEAGGGQDSLAPSRERDRRERDPGTDTQTRNSLYRDSGL